jgi:hypothetical protein
MVGQPARESAYAELVAGLLDARDDVATARFDAELATAEAEGRIDTATARTLRWWQRAAVRGVVDHARTAVPAVLAALDRAHDSAVDEADAAARAFDDAFAAASPEPDLPASPPRSVEAVGPVETPGSGEPRTAVDLTEPVGARRLLVAGLTPLPPP